MSDLANADMAPVPPDVAEMLPLDRLPTGRGVRPLAGDYGVDPRTADELARCADGVRRHQATALNAWLAAGRLLASARRLLPHGAWGAYCQRECGFSERHANNLLAVAAYADGPGISETVSDLAPTAILALARAPEAVRPVVEQAVVERVQAGAPPSRADVELMVREARAERTAAAADRLPPPLDRLLASAIAQYAVDDSRWLVERLHVAVVALEQLIGLARAGRRIVKEPWTKRASADPARMVRDTLRAITGCSKGNAIGPAPSDRQLPEPWDEVDRILSRWIDEQWQLQQGAKITPALQAEIIGWADRLHAILGVPVPQQ